MREIMLIIGLVLFFILVSVAFWRMMVGAQKLHLEISAVKELAKAARTEEELQSAWQELIAVNKKCWHRAFWQRTSEIKVIIETKFEML